MGRVSNNAMHARLPRVGWVLASAKQHYAFAKSVQGGGALFKGGRSYNKRNTVPIREQCPGLLLETRTFSQSFLVIAGKARSALLGPCFFGLGPPVENDREELVQFESHTSVQ